MLNVCMYCILPGASRRNQQCEIIHAERGRGRTMGPDVMCTALCLDLNNISVLQLLKHTAATPLKFYENILFQEQYSH